MESEIDGVPIINGFIGNYQITVDYTARQDTNLVFVGRIFHIKNGEHKLVFRQNEASYLAAAIAAAEKLFKLPREDKNEEIRWI